MAPDVLRLLCSSRENLRVLEHFAAHPGDPPRKARESLGIPENTWYRSLRQLEEFGLIAAERAPGGKKVRSVVVTPTGSKAREAIKGIEGMLAQSPAALLLELKEDPPAPGSPRAGHILSQLALFRQRRTDWDGLEKVARMAEEFKRPAEALVARALVQLYNGDPGPAEQAMARALELLAHEEESLSYRQALHFHAAALDVLDAGTAAFREEMRALKLARAAGDRWMEAVTYMSIGVMKGRLGHFGDAVKYLERGVSVAEGAGLTSVKAILLLNLGFTRFFLDLDGAIEANDRAIEAARMVGLRGTLAHAQLNKALYLAAKGKRAEGFAALREATAEYRRGGEERGMEAHRDFADLIRRTLRARRLSSLEDLRDQALQSSRIRPSRRPAARKASRSGRGRRG